MKLRYPLVALFIAVPQVVLAATVTGKLVGGGGVDDMRIIVQASSGQKVEAYCTDKCPEWFVEDAGTEVYSLKKSVKGKKIVLDYAVEPNQDRIAGPGPDEALPFVKAVRLLP